MTLQGGRLLISFRTWWKRTNEQELRTSWATTKRTERANLIWGGRFSERNIGDWGRSRRNSGGGGTVHHGNFYSGVSDERQRTRMWAGRGGRGQEWYGYHGKMCRIKSHGTSPVILPVMSLNKYQDTCKIETKKRKNIDLFYKIKEKAQSHPQMNKQTRQYTIIQSNQTGESDNCIQMDGTCGWREQMRRRLSQFSHSNNMMLTYHFLETLHKEEICSSPQVKNIYYLYLCCYCCYFLSGTH